MTIRELREEKKLTQPELAKVLGVTPGTIAHLEHGRMKLSANLAAKVWDIYGVALDLPEGMKTAPKKLAPQKKYANEIIIQSPMGGEITTEQIAEKLPDGADCVFVRVDQNKLWWIRGEETGNVDIWD